MLIDQDAQLAQMLWQKAMELKTAVLASPIVIEIGHALGLRLHQIRYALRRLQDNRLANVYWEDAQSGESFRVALIISKCQGA